MRAVPLKHQHQTLDQQWRSRTPGRHRWCQGRCPQNDDVRPHPHIGIATLSYLFNGTMTHRHTLGAIQVIEPGAVNWMDAGRGVVHSERYEALRRDGGMLHGVQIWSLCPKRTEEMNPVFITLQLSRFQVLKARAS